MFCSYTDGDAWTNFRQLRFETAAFHIGRVKKRKKRKIMECFCLVTIGRHCDILIEETLCNDVAIPGRLRNQRKLVSWLIMAGYHHVLACAKGEKMWARYNERAACEHLPKALHAINYVWSIWIVKKYLPGTELFHVKLLHFHPLFMTSLYNTFCNISVRQKNMWKMFGRQWNLEEILCGPYIDERFFLWKKCIFHPQVLQNCDINHSYFV